MASVDELDVMMRSGLEALAPAAPADLEEIVVTRLARRKQRRVTRNALAGVFALLAVLGVAGLFTQHDGQRVHIERGPSGTKTHRHGGKGAKNNDSVNDQLPSRPGGIGNGDNAGNGAQPADGAVGPGGAPATGTNNGTRTGTGGRAQPGGGSVAPPPNGDVPKVVVTLNPSASKLQLSQPSVPAGPVDVEFVNDGGPPSAVLAVLASPYVTIHGGETARVSVGATAVVTLGASGGRLDRTWPGELLVTPAPLGPPSSPDTMQHITIVLHDGEIDTPYRRAGMFAGNRYTTFTRGTVTFHVLNPDRLDRNFVVGSVGTWRIRPKAADVTITVPLDGAIGYYILTVGNALLRLEPA